MAADRVAAARLVRRTGFGATGASIDTVAREGLAAAARRIVATAEPAMPPHYDEPAPIRRGASADERRKRNRERRTQLADLTAWWIRRMATAEEPFTEKLTFVWHGHFATSALKVRSAAAMAQQNGLLRELGRRDFRTLAYGMLTDPAMLRWLDGEKNTASAPNENLSREFMELFALGHGNGYTEQDVREGARALTGWRLTPSGPRVDARLHDGGTKTVLGVTGPLDAAGFCDAVLAAPASPGYVAGRLWARLVSATPPSAGTRDRLVAAYGRSGSLSALLVAMLSSDEFGAARGTVVASPVEWLVGAARALRVSTDDVRPLLVALRALGQVPFFPPSVGGWPSGQAWLSTAAADTRLRIASALAQGADLPRLGSGVSALEAVGELIGVPSWSDRSAAALTAAGADPVRLVATALVSPENLSD